MAKKPKQTPTPRPELPGHTFTDKQLQEKAQRWAGQIARASSGNALANDTIPGALAQAQALARGLFTAGDAAVFLTALTEAVQ
jgi:hypothetical protein